MNFANLKNKMTKGIETSKSGPIIQSLWVSTLNIRVLMWLI